MARKRKKSGLTLEEYRSIRITKKIKFSFKAEKQYSEISKKFKITRREFADFYENIRKANRKAQRLASKASRGDDSSVALRNVEFSLNQTAKRISTREEFLMYRKAVNRVLKRNWRTAENLRQRDRTNENLREVFGDGSASKELTDYLDQLSDAEYNEFWENNKELKKVRWGSPSKAKKAAKFLNETTTKFEERIKVYEAKKAGITLAELESRIQEVESETGMPVELTDLRDILK